MTVSDKTMRNRSSTARYGRACDIYLYQMLGFTDYLDNCTDNLAAAMAKI